MNLLGLLLDLLYPPRCPFCGRLLERGEEGMCLLCQDILPWTGPDEARAVEGCEGCLSPLWYRDGVREAVHRYKFGGGRLHALLLGDLMAQCLGDRGDGGAELIVWVPLHPRDREKRGYDQAELLARRVGERAGLPVVPALEKVRRTATQSRLTDAGERRANVEGAYRVRPGAELRGRRVVLVDDVATSGATLSQCAGLLREAGAASVTALTLARAR